MQVTLQYPLSLPIVDHLQIRFSAKSACGWPGVADVLKKGDVILSINGITVFPRAGADSRTQ